MTADHVGPYRAGFGESAFWSPTDQAVWWVDLHGRALLRTRDNGETTIFKTPGFPANNPRTVVPRRDGGLIVALDDRLARFDAKSGAFTALDIALPVPEGHVLNDATVDAKGRLIIGTVRAAGGNDYRGRILSVAPDGTVKVLLDELCISNGLAFAPNQATLYVADSHHDVRTVWRAPYDPETGAMATPSVFLAPQAFAGRPDGAAVDSDGGYWIAELETGKVLRFTAEGAFSQSLLLPAPMPSRPCFGGPGNDVLYVTTAGPLAGLVDRDSGYLYRAATDYTGLPIATCAL